MEEEKHPWQSSESSSHEHKSESHPHSEQPKVHTYNEQPKEVHHKQHKEESKSGSQNPDKFWKTTTIVLIVVLGFFLLRGNSGVGDKPTVVDPSPSGQVAAPRANVDMAKLVDDDPVLGDANAPVTIVEFSDYQCPFCGRFYTQTLGQIKSQYIDTGKVKLVYRDFPLSFHQEATPAALAANCAGDQGKYWEFHDLVFQNQASIGSASYKQWAQELGLNVNKWESCLSDPNTAAEIQKDFQDGQAAGVTGTPGFIVNGQLISGAQPFSVFQQVIEAELS